jgi:hypothetical protein
MEKTVNASVTQYLYDGLNAVQELDGNTPPNPTANLLTGLNIDEYFTRTDSSGTATLLADALGSTIALTNPAGGIQTNYTYEPFGKVSVSGTSNANPYQFTGRENDGTGLYFYCARNYRPDLIGLSYRIESASKAATRVRVIGGNWRAYSVALQRGAGAGVRRI